MDEVGSEAAEGAATAAEEHLRDLQALSEAALAHLRVEDLLVELLDRIHAILQVDTVAILLIDEDTDELVARAAKGLEEEARRGTRIPIGSGFAGRIAAERRPIFLPDVEHADIVNPVLLEKGVKSLLGVPLLVQGQPMGVLHVGSLRPRVFTEEDTGLLQLAGDRVAVAIDHARLFEAERQARMEAQEAAERIERLQSISEVALSHLALDDELLRQMLMRVRENLDVDTVAMLLFDPTSKELVARAAVGLEEEVEKGVRIPFGGGFAGRVAAGRKPVAIEDVDRRAVLNPILLEHGIRSLLGVPLLVEDRLLGVLHVGSLTPRLFTDQETMFLQLAGDRIAVALDHARLFEREHLVAATLQRSLLPESLPRLPGLELAARYKPGEGETQLGGDWYDAMVLPSGAVGVALGDVVSRGLRAASVTAQLRNALRAYALEGHSPANTLERLSKLTRTLDRRDLATLVYFVVDPVARTVIVSSAGHPPPLVLDPDGTARFLAAPQSVPLGALREPHYEEREFAFEPRSLIMAYTDGLVERRDLWIDEGMEQLRELAAGRSGRVEEFSDAMLHGMLGRLDAPDDVALITLRFAPLDGTRFSVEVHADAGELAGVRRAMRQWLAGVGASEDESYELLVATTEAAANAVEHAYGPVDATFKVEAGVEDGAVEIRVIDSGRWRPPRGTNRGRGTLLMQELMDAFEVKTGDNGTDVSMRKHLAGA